MLSGTESLLPVAYGMWAWTIAVAVVLSMDSRYENHAGVFEEGEDVSEYAVGTPHDPRADSRRRQHDVEDGSTAEYAIGTPHNPEWKRGAKRLN